MFKTANQIEGVFWILIGVGFGLRAIIRRDRWRRACGVGAGLLVLFGCSDFVEVHTGAWWRPWWLLVWKGGCVLGLAGLLLWWSRSRARLG